MLSQCYKIKIEDPELCKPAQFVYPGNHSNIITGFVSHVEGEWATFTFFEPIEMPQNGINVKESLTQEEITLLLKLSLERNPEMIAEWAIVSANAEIIQ